MRLSVLKTIRNSSLKTQFCQCLLFHNGCLSTIIDEVAFFGVQDSKYHWIRRLASENGLKRVGGITGTSTFDFIVDRVIKKYECLSHYPSIILHCCPPDLSRTVPIFTHVHLSDLLALL
ncbi:hypothetical protein TNIN_101161 [Trichonephila inaurata madagascariensis]|uniref:Uncharacterized protein n=1 Tax=Trichonephila inaurata madagascariensis TaxID=2747483 RepID=A0A8X7C4G2_9ARAC|nr:hypothetical protein TNIN_101161 [Trichonephila inaurata madagascariensis]